MLCTFNGRIFGGRVIYNEHVGYTQRCSQKPNVCAHIIKTEYKQGESKVYIVCEGTEDLGYYGQVLKRKFSEIEINKKIAGGKNNVIEVYNSFDWNVYEKKKILFL